MGVPKTGRWQIPRIHRLWGEGRLTANTHLPICQCLLSTQKPILSTLLLGVEHSVNQSAISARFFGVEDRTEQRIP